MEFVKQWITQNKWVDWLIFIYSQLHYILASYYTHSFCHLISALMFVLQLLHVRIFKQMKKFLVESMYRLFCNRSINRCDFAGWQQQRQWWIQLLLNLISLSSEPWIFCRLLSCFRVSSPFFFLVLIQMLSMLITVNKLKYMTCLGPHASQITTKETLLTQNFFGVTSEISPALVTSILSSNLWNIGKKCLPDRPKTLKKRRKRTKQNKKINKNPPQKKQGNCKAFCVTRKFKNKKSYCKPFWVKSKRSKAHRTFSVLQTFLFLAWS